MFYYKICGSCGYAGTDYKEVIESEEEMTEEELDNYAMEVHNQNCGEYWWEEATQEDYENQ